ncbi:MAG TPA: glycosyltransferase family 4 protein [Vicinamibacteria bacterium]|nr:glycosyltransferase family 4 protein [Vicinamibacteria bacterium]
MIRVLHFADLVNRDDFIHNVISHVDPERYGMAAATLHDRGTLNADPAPLPAVHDLDCRQRRRYGLAVRRLRRVIGETRSDILHTHHYEPAVIGALATLGTRVRLVLGRHYSDAIYQLSRGWRRRGYLAVEALCNRRADAIVAPSRAVARVLSSQGVDAAKVAVIPYGFDFRRFGPRDPAVLARVRDEWPRGSGPRLATVARLHAEKGHRHLIEALDLLRRDSFEARWLVVGDGPERAALEAEVLRRGMEGIIRFAGWRTDVLDIVAAADMVVQPTLHEAFSQVMVETMALGTPLVISDVSGVEDVVESGRSGLVVPPRDSSALSAAIRDLSSADRARTIGAGGHARVRGLLDIGAVARRFEDLYRRVAGREAA